MKTEEKLHTLRKQKGITQAELAEIMDVSRQAVSRWESGVAVPSIENLKRICSLYDVPLDYLLNDGDENDNQSTINRRSQTQLNAEVAEQESFASLSLENSNSEQKKKRKLIVGILIGVITIFIIIGGIIIKNLNNENQYVNYEEMVMDDFVSQPSSNENFDLQW